MNKRVISITVVSVIAVAIIATMISVIIPVFNKETNEKETVTYTVSFFMNNKLLEEQKVESGKGAVPPAVPLVVGKIFKGWDTDVSKVESDLKVNALFDDLGDNQNIFTADNVYLKSGKTAVVNIVLRGNVNIATADFTIEYDGDKINLDEIAFCDPAIEANHIAKDSKVKCSLLSLENITGEVDCLQLVFSAKESGGSKSDIKVTVDDASMLQNDKIVDAAFSSINGSVTVID